MRVMHVVEAMRRGGAESLVIEHVRHAGPGVDVLVCALNEGGPSLEAAAAAGARTFVLGKGGARLSGLGRLAGLMRAERITVVNGHNPTGALYATLAARLASVPVAIRTEHSLHYPGRHSGLYSILLEPLATALTRRVVCVCQAVLESHVSRLPWAARRFVTVANGISPAPHTRPRESVRRELGARDGERVVLTVGSLTRQKAQHVLLEAFARATRGGPAATLWIAGEGPLRASLEATARELGIAARVRWLGARADVPDLLQGADVFALSSQREGLPVTLLEAMRAGRPSVATRVGGIPEALVDGETGRLAPVGDAAALGEALAEVLAADALAARFGAAACARWGAHFTAERMVRETEALYRAELARAGGASRTARTEERDATA
jgi:glycosyltransferase involved in cell wall biosynthesis